MNIKEMDLLEKQDLREKVISRTEVLDKVGELLLLPSTEYATVKQVSDYYSVKEKTIQTLIDRNLKELEGNGYTSYRQSKVLSIFERNPQVVETVNTQWYKEINFKDGEKLKINNAGLRLFSKRAILNVGMLLRDSEIAKEVRTRLLDIVHDTEKSAPEIIENISNEITQEQQIYLRLGQAVNEGNIEEILKANAELNQLKNKRIVELEDENDFIKTHALTIIESRSVINRLVRMIAMKEYGSMFGKAYSELYTMVNYKLGINIKARNKKKNESYINTLTEEETFEVEKIVRSWAVEVGLDMEDLLKIA